MIVTECVSSVMIVRQRVSPAMIVPLRVCPVVIAAQRVSHVMIVTRCVSITVVDNGTLITKPSTKRVISIIAVGYKFIFPHCFHFKTL